MRFRPRAHVIIGLPDEDARREIFAIHSREKPLADDVDRDALAERTDGDTGADVAAVCREAATIAVRDYVHAGHDAASHAGVRPTSRTPSAR